MTRTLLVISILAACATRRGHCEEDHKHGVFPVLPELTVGEPVKTAPKIVGTLDDPIWKTAATAELSRTETGAKANGRAKIYLAQDETTLFVAVECFEDEKNLATLKSEATAEHPDKIWTDDSIEVFLDPANTRDSYYQIAVNPKGFHWEAYYDLPKISDKPWKPELKAAATIGKESWIVTLAIPMAALNRTDSLKSEWAFNVIHTRTAANELLYWSPTFESTSHRPEKFGRIKGLLFSGAAKPK